MFIHIWMHWFWITAAYLKGFLLLTTHTISLSCIYNPHFAEAGLLDNETFPPITTPHSLNDSSQTGKGLNITSPIVIPPDLHPTSPDDLTTEESTTTRPEDSFKTALGSSSDMPDTYNGGTLDSFQYPLKKFTKYSHPKYGKTRAKGKTGDEAVVEERKAEAVKIVEEKVNINISIGDDVTIRSGPEVDKNDSLSDGGTSEIPPSDAPDLITTTAALEDASQGVNLTQDGATKPREVSPDPPEEQKELEILKNETLVIENKVEETRSYTTVEPFVVKNRVVAAATSAHNYDVEQSELNAGSITGITLGILVVFSLFGAVSFVLYRRRYLNKPEVLHDKCSNLDSSGYIDETSLRENSEEMYSLDNDSFLNSLEAMTIQNYWTESVKHTKL